MNDTQDMMMILILALVTIPILGQDQGAGPGEPNAILLNLERAQCLAIQNSPTLEAILETVHQAQHQLTEARSGYWPGLSADARALHREPSDRELAIQRFGGGVADESPDTYDLSLNATWLLFDGFRREYATKTARLETDISKASLKNAQRQLLEAVAQTFFQAQLADQEIRTARADLAFNQRLFREAELQHRAGQGSATDQDNFRIRMNRARANLIQQQSTYRAAFITLAALMGRDPVTFTDRYTLEPLGTSEAPTLPPQEAMTLVQYARSHRPDLAQDHLRIRQADAGIRQARSAYWPTLSLSGRMIGERPDNPEFEDNDVGYAVSLNLSYALFDGWSREAKVSQAHARRRQLRSVLRQKELDIDAEVREAIITLRAAAQQVPIQQENATLARQVRDREEKSYRAGQTPLVRLNEVQRDLVEAEALLALARVRLALAREQRHAATAYNLERIAQWQAGSEQTTP